MAGLLALSMALGHLALAGPSAAARPSAASDPLAPAGYSVTRCGNTSNKVLLTFDDWSYRDPYRATAVGQYLQSRNVRAAFFLINEYAQNYPDIVRTLRRQGHWVANHTYSHLRLTKLSEGDSGWEIENGVRSNLLRPPYGAFGVREESIARDLGYRICTWTIDTLDWEKRGGAYRSTQSIRSIVRNSAGSDKTGGVILGHLDYNYPDAVGGIIDDLHAEGYQFCRNSGPVEANAPFPLDCG